MICTALLWLFACKAAARALELTPITGQSDTLPGQQPAKRLAQEGLTLLPISDPSVLTHGRSLRREKRGYGCFDPLSKNSFFWGAYAGDNMYIANFTLSNPGDDEFILPVETFAKRLKSIQCGSPSSPYMNLVFKDMDSFSYAQSAWDWVNKEDINKFTLVTEPNQCYDGDNRSPYLVRDITFDTQTLTARLHAEEKEWADIAHTFKLHLGHEYINPISVNVTHPHLKRGDHVLDLTHDFNLPLFNFGPDETPGISLSADAQISTGGQIISDFDIETKWFIPRDVKLSIRPQGLQALFQLNLQANGKLGKDLDYALKPEIEIPVMALNIKGILEIGPFVTMGVHLGASALEGTASFKTGARAFIEDTASVNVQLRHPEENGISGWTPRFEKLDTEISASIHGSVKAWAELGIIIKAEAFGKWGYQAGLEAQLPYFEAKLNATFNPNGGVCGTDKTAGVEFDANVGININLNAGKVNKAPSFQKELFETSWPLFSTCVGFGGDAAKTQLPAPTITHLTSELPVTTTDAASTGPVHTSATETREHMSTPTPESSVVTSEAITSHLDLPTSTSVHTEPPSTLKTYSSMSTVAHIPLSTPETIKPSEIVETHIASSAVETYISSSALETYHPSSAGHTYSPSSEVVYSPSSAGYYSASSAVHTGTLSSAVDTVHPSSLRGYGEAASTVEHVEPTSTAAETSTYPAPPYPVVTPHPTEYAGYAYPVVEHEAPSSTTPCKSKFLTKTKRVHTAVML